MTNAEKSLSIASFYASETASQSPGEKMDVLNSTVWGTQLSKTSSSAFFLRLLVDWRLLQLGGKAGTQHTPLRPLLSALAHPPLSNPSSLNNWTDTTQPRSLSKFSVGFCWCSLLHLWNKLQILLSSLPDLQKVSSLFFWDQNTQLCQRALTEKKKIKDLRHFMTLLALHCSAKINVASPLSINLKPWQTMPRERGVGEEERERGREKENIKQQQKREMLNQREKQE